MSASASTTHRQSNRDDRARARRHVVDSGLVNVELCPAGFGLLLNLSEDGIGIYTLTHLEPGDAVQVSFTLPNSAHRIDGHGELVWAADTHAGLRLKVDQSSKTNLRNWISSLPSEPAMSNPVAKRRKFNELEGRLREMETTMATATLPLSEALQLLTQEALKLTSATGAALALSEGEQMICRASAGLAPDVGVHIDSSSGVTAECIRTAAVVVCEDTELDPRVDREVCRELELRSLLIIPVLWQQNVVGVLELFSNQPARFSDDIRSLALRVAELASHLAYPHEPAATSAVEKASNAGLETTASKREELHGTANDAVLEPPRSKPHSGRLAVTIIPALLVVGALFWHSSSKTQATIVTNSAQSAVLPASATGAAVPAEIPHSTTNVRKPLTLKLRSPERSRTDSELIASDSVVNNSARLREPSPSTREDNSTDAPPAIAAVPDSKLPVILPVTTATPELEKAPNWTGGLLVHRVEPMYPRATREQHLQGDVLLQAHIAKDGHVVSVRRVKGNPVLASAAISAVRQWRYEPFQRDNLPQEMDISVTVRFELPQ